MNKQLDFLFLYLDTPDRGFEGFTYCTGTAKIIWKLRSSGYTAEQFISKETFSFEGLASTLKEIGPGFLGITCYDDDFPMVATLARHLKEIAPEITVVLGGPAVMFADETILEHYREIDMCVRGEGEYACLELLDADADLPSIKGLTYRRDGIVRRSPDRPPMSQRDMNSFPSVYSDGLIPMEYAGTFGVQSSRGCVFRCTFCHCSALTDSRVRFYDDEAFLEEIDLLAEFYRSKPGAQPVRIFICDEAFTLNRKRTIRLCSQLAERDLPFEPACITRGDLVDEEVLRALYSAGIRSLGFGLESAVLEVLYNVRKARTLGDTSTDYETEQRFVRKFKEIVALAVNMGFLVFVEVVIGLPGETREDACTTLEAVKRLGVLYQHHILRVFTGTRLWHDLDRYGISVRKYNNIWHLPLETDHAYDVRSVPILWEQETYHQRPLMAEMRSVAAACTGIDDRVGAQHSPILCHGTPEGGGLDRAVGERFRVGSRLLFLDTDYITVWEPLSGYIFPINPPVFLSREAQPVSEAARIKLTRQTTPLDEHSLSFEFRVKTLSDLCTVGSDRIVIIGNESLEPGDGILFLDLVMPTIHDIDLLERLEADLLKTNSIDFHLRLSALKTIFADHCLLQGFSPHGGSHRELLDEKGDPISSMSGLFSELEPLVNATGPQSIGDKWQVLRYLALAPQILRGLTSVFRGEERFAGDIQVTVTANARDSEWVYGSVDDLVIRYSLGKAVLQVLNYAPGRNIRSTGCAAPIPGAALFKSPPGPG
ncbi:B12-binding domain-containing radical SAM protein [Thermodesulfobacteriota bacterium]